MPNKKTKIYARLEIFQQLIRHCNKSFSLHDLQFFELPKDYMTVCLHDWENFNDSIIVVCPKVTLVMVFFLKNLMPQQFKPQNMQAKTVAKKQESFPECKHIVRYFLTMLAIKTQQPFHREGGNPRILLIYATVSPLSWFVCYKSAALKDFNI